MRMMIASLMVGLPLNVLSMERGNSFAFYKLGSVPTAYNHESTHNDRRGEILAPSVLEARTSLSRTSFPPFINQQLLQLSQSESSFTNAETDFSSANMVYVLSSGSKEEEKREPVDAKNLEIFLDYNTSIVLENSTELCFEFLYMDGNLYVYREPGSNKVLRCWDKNGRARYAHIKVRDKDIFLENSEAIDNRSLKVVHNKILLVPEKQGDQWRLWDLDGNMIATDDYKFIHLGKRVVPFEGAAGLDTNNFRVEGKYIIHHDPAVNLITDCWTHDGVKKNIIGYRIECKGKSIRLKDSARLRPGSFFYTQEQQAIVHISLGGNRRAWDLAGECIQLAPEILILELLDFKEPTIDDE